MRRRRLRRPGPRCSPDGEGEPRRYSLTYSSSSSHAFLLLCFDVCMYSAQDLVPFSICVACSRLLFLIGREMDTITGAIVKSLFVLSVFPWNGMIMEHMPENQDGKTTMLK